MAVSDRPPANAPAGHSANNNNGERGGRRGRGRGNRSATPRFGREFGRAAPPAPPAANNAPAWVQAQQHCVQSTHVAPENCARADRAAHNKAEKPLEQHRLNVKETLKSYGLHQEIENARIEVDEAHKECEEQFRKMKALEATFKETQTEWRAAERKKIGSAAKWIECREKAVEVAEELLRMQCEKGTFQVVYIHAKQHGPAAQSVSPTQLCATAR
jgi:hypothetical protein